MDASKKFEFEVEVFLDQNNTRLVVRCQAKAPIDAWNATRMLADAVFDMGIKNKLTPDQMAMILNEAKKNNTPEAPGAVA